jgi:DNA-binding GntR family transcriptional regulator
MSNLFDLGSPPKIQRSSLRGQAVSLLRHAITSGRLPPGTKLVEREVAEMLGISRAPARDALMELEKEGLIETLSSGRQVIELSERDIRELMQVRLALETLAAELAVENSCPENCAALQANLEEMHAAIQRHDYASYVASDVDMHQLIWEQSGNRKLQAELNAMIGPIFMFVAANAEYFDWSEVYDLHEDLVADIRASDKNAVRQHIQVHMDSTLQRSLSAFRRRQQPGAATHPD